MIRKNIQMSSEVASWYEERAKKMGISQSALMVVALSFYIEYQQTLQMGSDMKLFMEKMNSIKSKEE